MTATQASELLDRVVVDRVLEVVDLEGLFLVQRQLFNSLCECGVEEEEAIERSRTMIRDALSRLANDFVENSECEACNIVAGRD